MRYNPALDGIRALACLAVVGIHANLPGFQGGYMGVDVFFVLSGYLITRVLLKNDSLPQFYLRRARRLYPALLFMLAGVLALQAMLGLPVQLRDAGWAAVYLTDIVSLPGSWFGHTWSLSVEEQFYLLWPLILLLRPTWRVLAIVALGAFLANVILRPEWDTARLFAQPLGLMFGCALALSKLTLPGWAGWIGAGLIVAAMWLFPFGHQNPWGILLTHAGTVLAIAGDWGPRRLAFVGKLSYGWYLWHFPLILLGYALKWSPSGIALAGVVGGLGMAALSYYTVEAWFRSAGHVFQIATGVHRGIGAIRGVLRPRKRERTSGVS